MIRPKNQGRFKELSPKTACLSSAVLQGPAFLKPAGVDNQKTLDLGLNVTFVASFRLILNQMSQYAEFSDYAYKRKRWFLF